MSVTIDEPRNDHPRTDGVGAFLVDQSAFILFIGLAVALVVMFVLSGASVPLQLITSPTNLQNIAGASVPFLLTSVGSALVMRAGGLDLSSQAVLGVSGAIMALALTAHGYSFVGAAQLALGFGVLAGAVIGIFVRLCGWHSAAFTALVAGALIPGASMLVGQDPIRVPVPRMAASTMTIQAGVIIACVLAAAAIGQGILFYLERGELADPPDRTKPGSPALWFGVIAFMVAGLLSAVAAIYQTVRLGTLMPGVSVSEMLRVLLPGLLAGGALFGSRCNLVMAVLAALAIEVLLNGFILMGIDIRAGEIAVIGLALVAMSLKALIVPIVRPGVRPVASFF